MRARWVEEHGRVARAGNCMVVRGQTVQELRSWSVMVRGDVAGVGRPRLWSLAVAD